MLKSIVNFEMLNQIFQNILMKIKVLLLIPIAFACSKIDDSEKIQLTNSNTSSVVTNQKLSQFNSHLLRKNKTDEPIALDFFDWGSEALINYQYRFFEADTIAFEVRMDSFLIDVPVVTLDSMNLEYYVEIQEVVNFLTEMNSNILQIAPDGFTPAIIDVERRTVIVNPSNAIYKITTIYKKPKPTRKGSISPNDPDFLVWNSVCPGGMPADKARVLINQVIDDFYFWNFPSWNPVKNAPNGTFFTDICWGNINATTSPTPSFGKCIDTYSCSNTFFGHSNCTTAPLSKTTCLSLSQINTNLNNAKILANLNRPTPNHQVAHCNLIDGWDNINSNNMYYFDRVYYGKPTSIAQLTLSVFP